MQCKVQTAVELGDCEQLEQLTTFNKNQFSSDQFPNQFHKTKQQPGNNFDYQKVNY